MTVIDINRPSLYVGTYGKYNNGSIAGAWLNLEDYADKDDFIDACQTLHGPGEHEFMFQDYSAFPRRFYSESYIDPAIWDWLELDEDDREMLDIYLDNVNQDGTIEQARDAFDGKHDSEADWAGETLDEQGFFADVPDTFQNYFDFEAYARDARLGGDMTFVRHEGYVWAFRNN